MAGGAARITDPARFTTEIYQAHVAGKPRLSGARAALQQLGVANAVERAEAYAEHKQQILEALIAARDFTVFPDALCFAQALAAKSIPLAVASSSKNANQMMRLIPLRRTRHCLISSRSMSPAAIYPTASRTRRSF